jgi:hypothetical protein
VRGTDSEPAVRDELWYSYAVIRAVPRVERGECLNVGVILFVRTSGFLEARIEIDERRLLALAPAVDLALLRGHLDVFQRIAGGDPAAGHLAIQPPSARFHWLTSPRSTMIQTSPVHMGHCDNPEQALEELLDTFVRPPGAAPAGKPTTADM